MVTKVRPAREPTTSEAVHSERLLVLSNRGPLEHTLTDGRPQARVASGGVTTALGPVAATTPVVWLAAAVSEGDRLVAREAREIPLQGESGLRLVDLPESAFDLYYNSFCNPMLWFLQHGMVDLIEDELAADQVWQAWEAGYLPANQAFAEAALDQLGLQRGHGSVMLHDYHLYTAPLLIRNVLPNVAMQHFVHIPWPGPEVWRRLPRPIVESICEGTLANDSVVFQTDASVQNYLLTIEAFCPQTRVDSASGLVRNRDRCTRAWANPISVDVEDLLTSLESTEVQEYRARLASDLGERTIVRVDRLDPTKNVIAGFEAFELMLNNHPEWLGKVSFLAYLVPTRTGIAEYDAYARDTFNLVSRINRRFATPEWTPIKVFFENNRPQAMAAMSEYDVLLVNSLKDGMNLVSKEGPVLNQHDGALLLSVQAGSYEELAVAALPVQPTSVRATAEALHHALTLSGEERRQRAVLLRQAIHRHQIKDWLRDQLRDLEVARETQTILADTTT
jgi:trehalose 6-phosphate synthase